MRKVQRHSARNYKELRALFDNRRIELKMKMWEVDVDARLQDGYFAKVICGTRNFGPDTLGRMLRSLGVEIVLMPSRLGTEGEHPDLLLSKRLKEFGSKGGRIARSRYTKPEWSKHCRRAARAKWARVAEAKKKQRRTRLAAGAEKCQQTK